MIPPEAAGFSLVEVMVAIAVIAGMTGMLFDTIATHARFAEEFRKRREATMIAESLMEQAVVLPDRSAPPGSGRMGSFAWNVSKRIESSEARDRRVPVQEIRVRIADVATGRQLVDVRTLRLAR